MRTSNKAFYATVIGRLVIFMARPSLTKQKAYREPIVVDKKRYPTNKAALLAAKHWEGILI